MKSFITAGLLAVALGTGTAQAQTYQYDPATQTFVQLGTPAATVTTGNYVQAGYMSPYGTTYYPGANSGYGNYGYNNYGYSSPYTRSSYYGNTGYNNGYYGNSMYGNTGYYNSGYRGSYGGMRRR